MTLTIEKRFLNLGLCLNTTMIFGIGGRIVGVRNHKNKYISDSINDFFHIFETFIRSLNFFRCIEKLFDRFQIND